MFSVGIGLDVTTEKKNGYFYRVDEEGVRCGGRIEKTQKGDLWDNRGGGTPYSY